MSKIEVGAYFYPLTTGCPERARRANKLGYKPVDETVLASSATPLFDGHRQPRTYCLGSKDYTQWDDSDPDAMARQLELARDHGLDIFVFDTYTGTKNGRVVREMNGPLDKAFLGMNQSKSIKFALMMVFGSPRVVLPVPPEKNFEEPDRYYDLNNYTAHLIIDDCVLKYWNLRNYYCIGGQPYLSIFTSDLSANGRSKTDALKQIIEEMKVYSHKRYKIDPYIVGVVRKVESAKQLVAAGANALTGYAFLPDFGAGSPPVQIYTELLARRMSDWQQLKDAVNVSFVPPAVVGWDASPRGQSNFSLDQVSGCYPYTPIVVESGPENFANMLRSTMGFVTENVPERERYGIICAWNEITEGAALLPELTNGRVDFGHLEVLKKIKQEMSE